MSDAKRLIPDGDFLMPSLWIRSSQTTNAASLIRQWLKDIDYMSEAGLDSPEADGGTDTYTVYSVSGKLVGHRLQSVDHLKGLYIINGKKVCNRF